jgi:PilZ domain
MRKLIRYFMSSDPRRSPRHVTPPLVTYYYDGDRAIPSAHRIQDISSTGLYLLTERRWYPGTLIIMTLQMTEGTHADGENAIAVLAKVIRSGSDGVGFQFIFTSPVDARNVKSFDGSRLVDKKALNRFLRKLH